MNFIAHSHLVITTKDVALINGVVQIDHFQNKGFSEFILPSGFLLFTYTRENQVNIPDVLWPWVNEVELMH